MPTSDRATIYAFGFAALGLLAPVPAMALDPQPAPPAAAAAPVPIFKDPRAALHEGVVNLRRGDPAGSVNAFRYAAEGGETWAQWKLGRMYASGEGVARDDRTAYQYFVRIVREYNEEQINPRDLPMVASAFVAVGVYSLSGIPNTAIKRDAGRAQEMFHFAATTFGDPNAQYNLALMHLEGNGVAKSPRQAVPWLSYAAAKNHIESQAMLGKILFDGADGVPKQRARGLMFLTQARESAGAEEKYAWIAPIYDRAMAQATDFDREAARIEQRKQVRRAVPAGRTAQ